MFKKIILVSIITFTIDFFWGDKATDVISSLLKAAFYSKETFNKEKIFTKEELKLFNGIDRPELYLAVLGNIFDVSRGFKHYGPNKQYNIFIGQDASRNFITGKFNQEDISEDVADFSHKELRSINHWLNFYKKEYNRVGLLIGKYYDENGKATPYGEAVTNLINDAEVSQQKSDVDNVIFPSCNVEWNPDKGTRVWCSDKSGGIERNWIGVPRQLFEPESKTYRCACISTENEKLGTLTEYEGCDGKSVSCFIKQN